MNNASENVKQAALFVMLLALALLFLWAGAGGRMAEATAALLAPGLLETK